jgi:hypothetical protein
MAYGANATPNLPDSEYERYKAILEKELAKYS